jgi:hypothetical protein
MSEGTDCPDWRSDVTGAVDAARAEDSGKDIRYNDNDYHLLIIQHPM